MLLTCLAFALCGLLWNYCTMVYISCFIQSKNLNMFRDYSIDNNLNHFVLQSLKTIFLVQPNQYAVFELGLKHNIRVKVDINKKLQWGSEYWPFEYRKHLNTKLFEVQTTLYTIIIDSICDFFPQDICGLNKGETIPKFDILLLGMGPGRTDFLGLKFLALLL